METIHQYIFETPEQLRKNFKNRYEIVEPVLNEFIKNDFKRIAYITCGSSLNACNTAKYFIEKVLKVKVDCIPSYTFELYESIFEKDTFYVGMGQSGRSTNTNNAMSKVKDAGYVVVGVSGNTESEMRNHCNVIVDWNVGIEKIGFVTKGFDTAVFFWMMFALETAKKLRRINENEYNHYCKEIEKMIDALEANIPVARTWVDAHDDEFFNIDYLQVTGVGYGYGVACEGSLKMEEVLGKRSSSYELEEFLHGPCYELRDGKAVYLIDSNGIDKQRIIQVFHNIHTLTNNVYLVTNQKIDDPNVIALNYDLEDYCTPIVNALVLQCMAANIHAKWQNPNLAKRMAFTESLGVKSQKTGKEVGL